MERRVLPLCESLSLEGSPQHCRVRSAPDDNDWGSRSVPSGEVPRLTLRQLVSSHIYSVGSSLASATVAWKPRRLTEKASANSQIEPTASVACRVFFRHRKRPRRFEQLTLSPAAAAPPQRSDKARDITWPYASWLTIEISKPLAAVPAYHHP